VNQMQVAIFISYLLMTGYFFSNWLRFTLRNPACSPEDKFLSFVISLITIIFWPFMIMISCWAIIKNRKLDLNSLIPVLLAMFALSISYYLNYLNEQGFCSFKLFCPLS